jgi:hypothetical protein
MPLFLIAAGFWAFGPPWSWIPFNAIFWLLTLITLAARPSRLAVTTPMAAQSTSSTFSLNLILSIALAAAMFFRERYWELIPCTAVFLISGYMWPRLRTLGPM